MENFVLYDEIGKGSYGTVYKGRKRGTIKFVAIQSIEKSQRSKLQNHVRISHELNHNNIVKFYEWYETNNHMWIVIELCSGSSLDHIIKQDLSLPEETIRNFSKSICHGLYYLHSNDIIYYDLRPKKIILDSNGDLKLLSFRVSRFIGEDDEFEEQYDDNVVDLPEIYYYKSPSIINGDFASKESDLWALGCVIYEMFVGKKPFIANRKDILFNDINNKQIQHPVQTKKDTVTKASDNLFHVIDALLEKDDEKRITWSQLCNLKFWNSELDNLMNSFERLDLEGSSSDEEENLNTIKHFAQNSWIESTINSDSNCLENTKFDDTKQDHHNSNSQSNVSKSLVGFGKGTYKIDKPYTSMVINSNKKDDDKKGKLEKGLQVEDLTTIDGINVSKSNDVAMEEINLKSSMPIKNKTYKVSRSGKDTKKSVNPSQVIHKPIQQSTNGKGIDGSKIGTTLNVVDHLCHPSDLVTSPIAENSKIAKIKTIKYDSKLLTFDSYNLTELYSMKLYDVNNHIESIIKTIMKIMDTSSSQQRQLINCLSYLCTISKWEATANAMIANDLLQSLIKALKKTTSIEVKTKIGRLLGIIFGNATQIEHSFNMSDMLTSLADVMRQNYKNFALKLMLLPALGECLFFAASQEDAEDKIIDAWSASGAVYRMISKSLQPGENDIIQHYAAKIIENITGTTSRHSKNLISNEIAQNLWVFYNHAVSDVEKATSLSALSRIAVLNPPVIHHVAERIGINNVCDAFSSSPPHAQQSIINIYIILLSNSHLAKEMASDTTFLQKLIQSLESSSNVVRGKLYLLVGELATKKPFGLISCFQARLLSHIERDVRKYKHDNEKQCEIFDEKYTRKCLNAAMKNIKDAVPLVLTEFRELLNHITDRSHPSTTAVKQLSNDIQTLTMVLYLVTNHTFRKDIVNKDFLANISFILKSAHIIHGLKIQPRVTSGSKLASEEISELLFSIMEAVMQHQSILLRHRSSFITLLLPELAKFCSVAQCNFRILSLKLLSEAVNVYFDGVDPCNSGTTVELTTNDNVKTICKIIEISVAPHLDVLLFDQEPIPIYTLKLIQAIGEQNTGFIYQLITPEIANSVFNLYQQQCGQMNFQILSSINSIFNSIVSLPKTNIYDLGKYNIVSYILTAFVEISTILENEQINTNANGILFQLLDTLHNLLKKLENPVKVLFNEEKLNRKKNVASNKNEVEELLLKHKSLSDLHGILIALLCYEGDDDIKDWACRCLYISVELFGGQYQGCFTEDSLESLADALNYGDFKRKKLLLRVVKRLLSSNTILYEDLVDNGKSLITILKKISKVIPTDTESKYTQLLAVQILDMISHR